MIVTILKLYDSNSTETSDSVAGLLRS